MKFKSILSLVTICCFSCATYNYFIEEVKNGHHLENAMEENINEFFKKRMTNRAVYKSGEIQRRWNIIFEDSNFVYYGFTQHKNFSGVDIPVGGLNELFKVDIRQIKKLFPEYTNIQGYHLIDIALKSMDRKEDNRLFHEYCGSGFNDWNFDIEESHYLINYDFYCPKEFFPKSKSNKIYAYKFIISKKDLTILKREREVLIN